MSFDGYIIVREVALPYGVHGMTKEDPDGLFNIYVNESDSREEREKTLRHELNHCMMGHIGSGRPVYELEEEAE